MNEFSATLILVALGGLMSILTTDLTYVILGAASGIIAALYMIYYALIDEGEEDDEDGE